MISGDFAIDTAIRANVSHTRSQPVIYAHAYRALTPRVLFITLRPDDITINNRLVEISL